MAETLILGHTGMVGQALMDLEPSLMTIKGHRQAFDLLGGIGHITSQLEKAAPKAVINCIALSNVDACEKDPDLARQLNAEAAGNLAYACNQLGIRLIHLSTDYVFNGRQKTPYKETDQPSPLSQYGQSKLKGEAAVLQNCPSALVTRTAWVFGPARESYVERPLRQYMAGGEVKVVDDQVSSPTWAPDLARALLKLVDHPAGGILHVAGKGFASRLAVAEEFFKLAGLNPASLQPAKSKDFGGAPRPAFSALDTSLAESYLGSSLMPWREALACHWAWLKTKGL